MTVQTGVLTGDKKQLKSIEEHKGESHVGAVEESDSGSESVRQEGYDVDVKDTKILVQNEELPLPKLQFKQKEKNTGKKVSFNLPEDEDIKWRRVLMKLLMLLLCLMTLLAISKFALMKYQSHRWEQERDRKLHYRAESLGKGLSFVGENAKKNEAEKEEEEEVDSSANRGQETLNDSTSGGQEIKVKVGKTDVWFSIGSNQWRLDSGDRHKNYSILTDVNLNYTVVKLTKKPDDVHSREVHGLDATFFPVCYVCRTELLKLPSIHNMSKFLDGLNNEADMIVTKMAESLFFDIGQPIGLDQHIFGSSIHKFCSGATAFELKPMNLLDEIRRHLENESMVERVRNNSLREHVANVVKKLESKMNPRVVSEPHSRNESMTTAGISDPLSNESGPWSLETQRMQAPLSLIESAEELQRINNELMRSLHSGHLFGSLELMQQFHQVIAYLPIGDYTLHSPKGVAMNFHIRRQSSPTMLMSSMGASFERQAAPHPQN